MKLLNTIQRLPRLFPPEVRSYLVMTYLSDSGVETDAKIIIEGCTKELPYTREILANGSVGNQILALVWLRVV